MKIRRVGNSNVVTLPRSLEAQGYAEGAEVRIVPLPDGAVLLMPEELASRYVLDVAERMVKKYGGTLRALAEYDSQRV